MDVIVIGAIGFLFGGFYGSAVAIVIYAVVMFILACMN